ncbi:MAG TPA: hypothetical protein VHY08_10870 [Bacillota bacterium]|nr:hypothetical protein [Bacillota bacterium]
MSGPVSMITFEQQRLENGETKTHTLYTLPSHRSSLLKLTVIVHDVNSNTNRKYFNAAYAWYRQWDTAPTKKVLATIFDDNTGSGPAQYHIDTIAAGNDIQVSISQSGFDTNSYYTIIADVIFAVL